MSKENIFEIVQDHGRSCGYAIINKYPVVYKNAEYYYCKVNGSNQLKQIPSNRTQSILEFKESPQPKFNCFGGAYIIDFEGLLSKNNHYDLGIEYSKKQELKDELDRKVEILKNTSEKESYYYRKFEELKNARLILESQIKELYTQLEKLP